MELLNDINLYLPATVIAIAGLVVMMLSAFRASHSTVLWTSVSFTAVALARAVADLGTETQLVFHDMAAVGGMAAFGTVIILLGTIFTLLLSKDYFEKVGEYHSEVYAIILFATVGMIVLATATNLVTVFLGLETMSIALYVLAGVNKTDKRSIEAALKYFLLGAFSTGFFLYGIALLYGAAGSTSLEAIGAVTDKGLFYWAGAALLLTGFFFKISAVPFHMWTPDVYQGSPTPITGYMATAAKTAGFFSLIFILSRALGTSVDQWSEVIKVIAVLTMVFGNIIALVQTNVKRMLAYSSIAHAGYVLVGLAAGTEAGYTAVQFYLFAYTIMNIGAFGVIAYYERYKGLDLTELDNFAGLGFKQPMMAVMLSIFLFSLVGIPPLLGFAGKYLVFAAAVQANLISLAVIGVLTSAAAAYYYLRVMVYMYMRDAHTEFELPAVGLTYSLVIGFLAVLTVALGVMPWTVADLLAAF
ncbi:MAG: NADH-quinone oxidoreductase subunit N [Bacteroidetes bacterium]|nr:NADH-quinone oxidoreductase subunit N [Bacteroidota bacterium]MCH8524075.1 NADH-quinone oxidoreductase subunit N [Balneolales bacterium]